MKSRRLAPIALAAAVLFGTTGCSLIAPQATLIPYSPAEGVMAHTGDVEVRNAVLVSEDGVDGNLLAAFVNNGESAQTVTIEVSGSDTQSLRVPAGTAVSLGADWFDDAPVGESPFLAGDPILFEGIDTIPGATIEVYFQSGDGEGALVEVPILTGAIEYLEPFVP
ncbi:DNA modification methylase [Microbacterium sp. LRZ72]|uniref:DNA modification methylase n=1 Tax=Microbacterium sp. LRZ72 TaxID=2942481 RepID=UPI0029A796FB|nr:DNA modification methylase [Microbacterium sp. LRZ72]MDX2375952.1 DNA modification methylase [Microbacterium sp. LRZ72]